MNGPIERRKRLLLVVVDPCCRGDGVEQKRCGSTAGCSNLPRLKICSAIPDRAWDSRFALLPHLAPRMSCQPAAWPWESGPWLYHSPRLWDSFSSINEWRVTLQTASVLRPWLRPKCAWQCILSRSPRPACRVSVSRRVLMIADDDSQVPPGIVGRIGTSAKDMNMNMRYTVTIPTCTE